MENGKVKIKFVDVSKYGFISEPRYYFYGWSKTSKILGRESAVKALVKAKKFLPKGYNFKIWDSKRTYQVQELMVRSFWKRIIKQHFGLTLGEKKKLLVRFSGGLVKNVKKLDSHRMGGSFDLTIVDNFGNELYMGTDFDDLTEKAATDYFKSKSKLDPLEKNAKKNRELLKAAMSKAKFINYPAEWWHWSYLK